MASKKLLRYDGGADLTFRDAKGNRVKVKHGEQFAVDEETAAILLTDPAVVDVDAEASAAEAADEGLEGKTVGQLKTMLADKGLPVGGKKDELIERLEEADAAAPETPEAGGGGEPQPEAPATAPEDEGQGTGAITLGDVPKSGKVQQ